MRGRSRSIGSVSGACATRSALPTAVPRRSRRSRRCSVSVALPADRKGTHMSRLVALIDELREPLSLAALPAVLDTMLSRLEATSGRIEIEFPWFRRKAAPVSGVQSMMDYEAKLAADATDGKRGLAVTLVVPVMSLCPSSKAIADYRRAQPALASDARRAAAREASSVTLDELVTIAEEEASCELYALAEALGRKIRHRARIRSAAVRRGPGAGHRGASRCGCALRGFRVEAENFESIHNHSAYACIERGA